MVGLLRKIISLCLFCSLVAALVPGTALAASDSNIYLNESFADTATNSLPKGAQTEGSGSIIRVIQTEGLSKCLNIRNIWSDTIVSYSISPAEQKLVLETRFYSDKPIGKKALLQIRNSDDEAYDLVRLNGMKITDGLENEIAVYNGGWTTVTVEIDTDIMRYDISINGIKKVNRIRINGNFNEIKKLAVESYATSNEESSIKYDYLFAYGGSKILDFSDTKEYNTKVVKAAAETVTEPNTVPELLLDMDFEDEAIGSVPSSFDAMYGNQGVEKVTEKDGSQSAAYVLRSKSGVNPFVNISFRAQEKAIVVQARVKTGRTMNDGKLFIIKDSNSTFSECLHFNGSMQLLLHNGTAASNVTFKNQWHDVAVAIDFAKQIYDVYIDKELVQSGINLQRRVSPSGIMRFQPASTASSDETALYIDYIRMYTGMNLYDFQESDDEVIDSAKEVYPYDVDDTKLNTKTDMLRTLTTGTPDKNCTYLNYDNSSKSVFDNSICFVTGQKNIGINGKRYIGDYPVIRRNNIIMAAARTLGIIGGDDVGYDAATGSINIGKWKFKVGDNSITDGSESVDLGSAVINENGVVYLPLRTYAGLVWHKYCGETVNGLVVINSDKDTDVSAESFKLPAKNMINYLIYDRPSGTELVNRLYKRYAENRHQRTVATKEQIERMDWAADNTEVGRKWSEGIIAAADAACSGNIVRKDTEGQTIEGWVQYFVPMNLYWAYHRTGDNKYLDRAVAYAENLASYDRWKASNNDWITCARIMLTCGIIYDLFYYDLSDGTRQRLAEALVRNGLNSAIEHYNGRGASDWPIRESNWNIVCNTGVIVAATAIMEEYPDLCRDAMEKAVFSLEREMDTFAPDGGGIEGLAYWELTVQHMVMIFQTMENAYGDDFGLEKFPGILETGYFPIYASGTKNYFAYGDADNEAFINSASIMWFSNKSHDVNLQNARIQQCENYGYALSFLDLLWYMPENDETVNLTKDAYYRNAEVATMRGSWDEFSAWVGIHAGYNSSVHGQYDIGDFEYELYGERMACNMGRDDYNLPGYFNTRDKYYVHRTEGQNCYVINPDATAGQEEKADAKITPLFSNNSSAACMIDMSPAYKSDAKSAKRGYMLKNNRRVFVVQDEIVPNSSSDDIYWFWHTEGDVSINNAEKTATIKKGWVSTTLYMDANVDFTVSFEAAEPMTSSPQTEGQMNGKTQKKIVVNFTADAPKVIFRVTAVPMYMQYDCGELDEISTWEPETDSAEDAPKISCIYINGQPMQEFRQSKAQYEVAYDSTQGKPIITADSDGVISVHKDADDNNSYIVECAHRNNPSLVRYYGITFKDKIYDGKPESKVLEPAYYEAYATATVDSGNLADNAFDNNLETRWAAEGDGSWLVMDLGEEKTVTEFFYAIYLGNQRKQYFTVELSSDGIDYEKAAEVTSTGTSLGYEHIKLNPSKARYVRLKAFGNSQNKWNSFTEVGVCGN